MNTTVTIPDTWLKQDFNKWIEKIINNSKNRDNEPPKNRRENR